MLEPAILSVFLSLVSFLFVMLIFYLWARKRNLKNNKASTPQEYLWKLKQITGKSEYDLFLIAAEEKGWPKYQVERHFYRYLGDQTLPVYVKQFLEDGRDHIDAYRSKGGDFLDKKLLIFYSLFALLIIGGSFFFCFYIYPRTFQFDGLPNIAIANALKINPRLARPFINRAISYAEKGQIDKACSDLNLACDSGYCESYNMMIKKGVCQ